MKQQLKVVILLEWENDKLNADQIWEVAKDTFATLHHKGIAFVTLGNEEQDEETPVEITGWAKL